MDTVSNAALIVLALVAFKAYRRGELGVWLRAKFFNQEPGDGPTIRPASILDAGAHGALTAAYTAPAGGPGGLSVPVAGPVTSPFGRRGGGFHEGMDIGVPIGTPVHAAKAGRVSAAGPAGGYGNRIDLDHGGGLLTRYAHLSRIDVRYGADVAAGAVIGLSGNTGESTGPHVHFEVRQDGIAKNPAGYLTAGYGAAVSA